MTKLRFDNISLSGFNSFKLVEKKRKPRTDTNKRLTKLIQGICIKEGDDYKISVKVNDLPKELVTKSSITDCLVIDFTEESYNLKGVISVFSRFPDENGKYTRYIRNENQCKFFPGNKEKLVPFCKNWICKGYVVRRDGKLMFEFNDCIAPNGYTIANIEDED